ncbi:hypothetical protein MHYP_G00088390 [Metynnis hypsauchen]
MTWIMQHNIMDQLQKVTSLQTHFTYASKLPNPLCRALPTGELPPSKIPPTPNMDYSHSYLLARGCAVLSDSERRFSRSPGESVLLPCPCLKDQHRISPDRVTWSFSKTASEDKIEWSINTEPSGGRVRMFDQKHSRNFSLLISDLTKEDYGSYTCRADEKDMPYISLEVTAAGHISFLLHVLLRVSESGCPLAVSYRRITQTTAAGKAGGAQFSDCSGMKWF